MIKKSMWAHCAPYWFAGLIAGHLMTQNGSWYITACLGLSYLFLWAAAEKNKKNKEAQENRSRLLSVLVLVVLVGTAACASVKPVIETRGPLTEHNKRAVNGVVTEEDWHEMSPAMAEFKLKAMKIDAAKAQVVNSCYGQYASSWCSSLGYVGGALPQSGPGDGRFAGYQPPTNAPRWP